MRSTLSIAPESERARTSRLSAQSQVRLRASPILDAHWLVFFDQRGMYMNEHPERVRAAALLEPGGLASALLFQERVGPYLGDGLQLSAAQHVQADRALCARSSWWACSARSFREDHNGLVVDQVDRVIPILADYFAD